MEGDLKKGELEIEEKARRLQQKIAERDSKIEEVTQKWCV